ncbi:MAG: tetratricopeptide repeat protein, partial [Myxococcales bacterium]|nr:tetratricopeptide repeat protein [Myxococcales bacterium]
MLALRLDSAPFFVAALSLGLAIGCRSSEAPAPLPVIHAAPTSVATPEPPPVDDSAYGLALVAQNAQIEALERAADRYSNDWGRQERLSHAYEMRASLTGDHDDYLRAVDALDRAFRAAPEGVGPFLSRAHLNYTLHRLDAASADLDAADGARLMTPSTRNSISTLRGDVAFHRGDFEEAERRHRATDEVLRSSSSAFRVAYDLWQTARFAEAERWLGVADARIPGTDGRTRAWMSLQMGLMDLDRGRYESALAHYEEADRRFDGWWLVHEHIAEVLVHLGRLDEAEERYRDVVARTDNPELIDALADLLEQRGRRDEAARFRRRADQRFEEQLARLPEAAYGHALEHFL